MKELIQFLSENDRFARHTGIELIAIEPGYARARLEIREYHLNSAGLVHGGAIFTLADLVFAAAANSYGNIALAINANINFIRGAKGGTLYAEARELACHPRLGTYSVRITDEEDNLLATFEGLVYRKKDKLIP
ncbi:MAG TPA: PaaI family thioesterase [bacterium]|nr:PaaI family thioesterase [bacterium]